MSGYVDIHAHVLPGIDDGPSDLESALQMLQAAASTGITTIAATPHLRSDFPGVHIRELAQRCQELRDASATEGIEIEIVPAAEVSVSWVLEASDDELRLASYGQQSQDLLIETPSSNVLGLDRILHELRVKGYRITLAHPERNADFRQDPSLLEALVAQGILLQVNAESLLGSRHSGVSRFARSLCRDSVVHVLASDGHRAERWRPVTHLSRGVSAAVELVGAERANWMASIAPRAIVQGTALGVPPDVEPGRRRLFGRR